MTYIKPFAAASNTLFARVLTCATAMLLAGAAVAQDRAQTLPAVTMKAGFHVIQAEVAGTPEQRQIGLMHRKEMPANDGMLFVFEQPAQQCFWMKNTLIPLSIAFLAEDGSVVNIEDMKPQSLDSHCSSKPVRFALEMTQGWFAQRGIKPGFRIEGAPFGTR